MSKIAKNFLIIIVLILSINSCTKKQETILGSENQNGICIYLDGNDLKYDTDIPIAGFQFNHNGCILNISGGDVEPLNIEELADSSLEKMASYGDDNEQYETVYN